VLIKLPKVSKFDEGKPVTKRCCGTKAASAGVAFIEEASHDRTPQHQQPHSF
jgi:hypothetical protein